MYVRKKSVLATCVRAQLDEAMTSSTQKKWTTVKQERLNKNSAQKKLANYCRIACKNISKKSNKRQYVSTRIAIASKGMNITTVKSHASLLLTALTDPS